ncbi:uncharacterized protein LOC120254759 isoform X2 [Dioscorea cayenensis subsp. rotundata]|uniref:Uncharacterized protein LOC120254759 isoform X2 n=1 Tax=Dioscorea cayennensis subsp. rotundata TaxID=55577 RepID=A0AB40AVA3_DIOCR|nr:uncharacterized protein LOC120254759 isoform X2 [Dioscorea cayenensis subsp. rotundata]
MTIGIACGACSTTREPPKFGGGWWKRGWGFGECRGEETERWFGWGEEDKEDEAGAVDSEGFGRGAAPAWLAAVAADAILLFEVGCGGVLILLRCLINCYQKAKVYIWMNFVSYPFHLQQIGQGT